MQAKTTGKGKKSWKSWKKLAFLPKKWLNGGDSRKKSMKFDDKIRSSVATYCDISKLLIGTDVTDDVIDVFQGISLTPTPEKTDLEKEPDTKTEETD